MAARAELDIDVRWAGEPDVLLKLEPSNKWLMNAVKIGEPALRWRHKPIVYWTKDGIAPNPFCSLG